MQGASQVEYARQTLQEDADDAIQRAGQRQLESAALDIDSAEIESISSALKRVDDADYGLCVDCGSAIPFERLKIKAQVTRCTDCQSAYESRT